MDTEQLASLAKFVNVYVENGTPITTEDFISYFKENGSITTVERCAWIMERGANQGKHCNGTAEPPGGFCRLCKNKKKAKDILRRLGHLKEDNQVAKPRRARNSLNPPIAGKVAQAPDTVKVYAYSVDGHPEFHKEMNHKFVVRSSLRGGCGITQAVYDDEQRTVRALTKAELAIAEESGYLTLDEPNQDFTDLQKILYPQKESFCENSTMSVKDALDKFLLDSKSVHDSTFAAQN